MYPETVEVTEGESVALRCLSFPPHSQALVEWDLSGVENVVSFANVSHSIRGSRNVTPTFTFQNVTKVYQQYVIKCTVILGSKNKTDEIIIIPQFQQHTTDVTTPSVASIPIQAKTETADTRLERKGKHAKESQTLFIIIIPVVVVLLTLCGIIGGIVICRKTRGNTSKTRGSDVNVPSTNYHDNNELQLSTSDAEVVHNIIYEPYTPKQL